MGCKVGFFFIFELGNQYSGHDFFTLKIGEIKILCDFLVSNGLLYLMKRFYWIVIIILIFS